MIGQWLRIGGSIPYCSNGLPATKRGSDGVDRYSGICCRTGGKYFLAYRLYTDNIDEAVITCHEARQ